MNDTVKVGKICYQWHLIVRQTNCRRPRGVGRGEAKGAAAPPTKKKEKRERGEEERKKEERENRNQKRKEVEPVI